ncbi:PREDICTED: trihelix transcription factor ASIL2 [Fragaria vesca subsp. vesca]|uniref:trihelix transcription factor ASIL2 n=1 Tax=Fragaria vesca subsp. vesca TaxID=101020 RepID=UPI0002C2F0F9|nr:PREDICTED: trihelix transcription factor ASIL2 [Fragaria vesca subsp. vesca]
MASSPPSSPHDGSPLLLSDPPHAVPLALPAPPSSSSAPPPPSTSRRLPPPCWSHDETVALIDSYRDKWYSLRRGNLKATHWQDVADAVSRRCPAASPAKTAVQCRHKMEKLRKRYRTEIQRARSMPLARFTSSWVHFKRMDAMEKGPAAMKNENSDSPVDDGEDEENDEEEDQDQELYEELRYGSNMKSMSKMYRNGVGIGGSGGGSSVGGGNGGFRIRIPTGVSIAQPGNKVYPKMDQKFGMNSHPGTSYATAKVMRECNNNVGGRGGGGLGKRERERDPVAEMVSAIKVLGDGFVRTEQTKIEMAREIETMRMEMEMKRTEMILESQQRIVDAFAKAVSEKKKKKAKRMPSPEV